MAIFISYSHQDAAFVDALAAHLIKAKAHVWVDRWELNVGDSLLRRIEEEIDKAGALVVVLSEASVESEWCRKELTAGLVRELDEKKVLILPVLLKDCAVFLSDPKGSQFTRRLRPIRQRTASGSGQARFTKRPSPVRLARPTGLCPRMSRDGGGRTVR